MIYDDIKMQLQNLKFKGMLQSFNDAVALQKEQPLRTMESRRRR
jgi:hypothetical protein